MAKRQLAIDPANFRFWTGLGILTKLCHSEPSDSEVKNLGDASLHPACPRTK